MKKGLRAHSRNVEEQILAENQNFYNEITKQYYPEQKSVRPNHGLIIKMGSLATACLLLVTCLSVVFYFVFKKEKIEYIYENEVGENTNLQTFQDAVPWFFKFYEEDYIYRISRTYDSVSGDNLFFELDLTRDSYVETTKIYLYINPNYKTDMTELIDSNSTQVNGIEVKYDETIVIDSDGFYNFSFEAQYYHDESEVYISYKQLWYEEDTHFFKFLEEIVS